MVFKTPQQKSDGWEHAWRTTARDVCVATDWGQAQWTGVRVGTHRHCAHLKDGPATATVCRLRQLRKEGSAEFRTFQKSAIVCMPSATRGPSGLV